MALLLLIRSWCVAHIVSVLSCADSKLCLQMASRVAGDNCVTWKHPPCTQPYPSSKTMTAPDKLPVLTGQRSVLTQQY